LERNSSPIFSTADDFTLQRVCSLLPSPVRAKAIPESYDYRLAPDALPRRGKSPLRDALRKLGLLGQRSYEKHIPDCYKYNTKKVRLEIIRGLFDTDGTVSPDGCVQLTTTSRRLAHDVVEVIQSLGGLCTINKGQGGYKVNGKRKQTREYYKLSVFYMNAAELFSLPRKKERCRLRTLRNAKINRSIREIQYTRHDYTQCIKVADSRGLYLTDNFIVTHNTAWNADTLRGDYADILILDEWQLMNEDAWELVGAPMMLDTNGTVIFIYTPPSLHSRSVSKANDPRHAAKLFKKYKKSASDNPDRYATFNFSSMDNPHLSRVALNEITEDMTDIAYRMEILAQDIDESPGALWKRSVLDKLRIDIGPDNFDRIVVAIDPSASSTGDEAGIIGAGRVGDIGYVLRDVSVQGSPMTWATAAIDLYHELKADRIVAEANNGGEMISTVIAQIDDSVPVTLVHASRGKATRAEPISARYEKGKVHHVGNFEKLENELCLWSPGDASPNRLDAMVWALTELLLGKGGGNIRVIDSNEVSAPEKQKCFMCGDTKECVVEDSKPYCFACLREKRVWDEVDPDD
jgi:hypothetical protein